MLNMNKIFLVELKNLQKLNDLELFKLYNSKSNVDQTLIEFVLQKRYNDDLSKIIRFVKKNFFSIPFFFEDFEIIKFLTIKKSLYSFKPHLNIPFNKYLKLLFTWNCKDAVKKHLTLKTKTLNLSRFFTHEQDNISNYRNIYKFLNKLKCVSDTCITKDLNRNIQNFVIESNIFNNIKKALFLLKSLGLDNNTILKFLDISYKQLDNYWQNLRINIQKNKELFK